MGCVVCSDAVVRSCDVDSISTNQTATPLVCSNYYVTEPLESTIPPTPSIPQSIKIDVSLDVALSKLALKCKHDDVPSSFSSDKRMKCSVHGSYAISNQYMLQIAHSNATQLEEPSICEVLECEKSNLMSIDTSESSVSRPLAPRPAPIMVSERKRRRRLKKNNVSDNSLSNELISPNLIDVPIQMLEYDIAKNSLKYTRSNQRNEADNIRERIDRALGNINLFEGLKNAQGEWVYDKEGIQTLVRDHFHSIYMTNGARDFEEVLNPVVSTTMNDHLQSPVTDSEIYKATKQLMGLKAPGEDGFPGMFYQRYWSILGAYVCQAVWYFFEVGSMPPEFNKTLVDSIVVANEAFHYIRNKKHGEQSVMALEVDLNKAFDRVEWDFLFVVLSKMGFGDVWCDWIRACLTTYELEFMVNGDSVGVIKPQRGLRQGDPISP
ncbi:reverse transcriptase, partial [Tanacetum coccineum]